jgi:hypothetical protein
MSLTGAISQLSAKNVKIDGGSLDEKISLIEKELGNIKHDIVDFLLLENSNVAVSTYSVDDYLSSDHKL